MAEAKAKTCPICEKLPQEKFHPFCSKRCSEIDLGHWFSEQYAVPTDEPANTDVKLMMD